MDGGKCILQLRGVRPFLSNKYDLTKHPKYWLTSDADEKNLFKTEDYLSHRLKIKSTDTVELYDCGEETTETED
jgi:type IV secretion system protein VirD4